MTHDAAHVHHDAELARLSAAGPQGPASAGQDLPDGPLLIDCDSCSVRGIGCGDCVVTVLLGGPPDEVTLNDEERRAVEVLAAAGLVPPLRLVQGVDTAFVEPA